MKILSAFLFAVCSGTAGAVPPPQPDPPPSLTAEGWYAGDLHVHREPREMEPLMTQAELHVASVITWWNESNLWKTLPPPASPASCDNGSRFYHLVGGEDERGGGALLFHNLARPIVLTGSEREWPPSVKFLREAKAAGAWCDIEKPFWNDVPVWLATGLADSVGICHNHLQIGGMMDNEAWGRPRDRTKYPGPHGNGLYTQDLYYHILNCGFRLPPTAGGASGVLANPVGYNRVYVRCEPPFTWEKWWAGLRRGQVFVSNGPQLRLRANDMWPGHSFGADTPLAITLEGKLDSRDPIRAVELVVDGQVSPIMLPHRFEMKASGWFLVRAITTVPHTFRFASTGPWYVHIAGRPAVPRRESVQLMLAWTEARRHAVDAALQKEPAHREEVRGPLAEAEDFWRSTLKTSQ